VRSDIIFTAFSELSIEVELLHADELVVLYSGKTFLIHIFVKLVFYQTGKYCSLVYLLIVDSLEFSLIKLGQVFFNSS